ncbi:hypothetical protein [Amycolatopsis circi]|uniref:hypothetical protein n=1 Tax=Amycolatopsis circi TaxID=871959 RepID=UPI000E263905|nr:hypothetical protein [Amycolatopsis circi]
MSTFPGPRLGGAALVLGPVLVLAGVLLRLPYPFFFPHQLAATAQHPAQMTVAATCFLAGQVVLVFAVSTMVCQIAVAKPRWAAWSGAFVLIGLVERVFHAGFDQAATDLARHRGADYATAFVADAYGDLHLFSFLSFTIMFGWPLLGFAAYRTGVLGPMRAVALATAMVMPLGVLKGTTMWSIAAAAGLCVALVPSGVRLLKQAERPDRRTFGLACLGALAVGALGYLSTMG